MLILKYEKLNSASYIPHLDTLRAFVRTIRRAELAINYSEGFNPHMRLFFANPIPVGTESECEYCAADSPEPPEFFLESFNRFAPPGICITAAAATPENPNVPHIANACGYFIFVKGAERFDKEISDLKSEPVIITSNKKTSDVSDRLISIACNGGKIYAVTKAGAENLRADRLAEFICAKFSLPRTVDILRKNLYNISGGKITSLDEYIARKYSISFTNGK